jgi:hypothetical protein
LLLPETWQLESAAGVHALRSMHVGFEPPVDVKPVPQAQVHPDALVEHVPRPAPHGFDVGLHAFTHVVPLNMNPASHLQLYPVAGAAASMHVALESPASVQWFVTHSFLSTHDCVFVPSYAGPHEQ